MKSDRFIAKWLLAGCVLIMAMVSIGAITRLTGSGLSIVEWNVVTGTVPPLNRAEWNKSFKEYKQSPQYKDVNSGMDLASFKSIFWWEYFHRLLGRFIGIFFIFQFVYFYYRKQLSRDMVKKYITIILGVGVVGAWGWFMVKSGLINVPRVSPYRLAIHLSLALTLLSFILWTALDLLYPQKSSDMKFESRITMKRLSTGVLVLLAFQIFFGGLMSGLRGAVTFHSFPLMDGRIIPLNMFFMKPFVVNFFENSNLVNFIHRTMPYVITILIFILWWKGHNDLKSTHLKIVINLLPLMVLVQITFGAVTVLNSYGTVPVFWGTIHQAGAEILLILVLIMTNQLQKQKNVAANEITV